MNIDIKAIKKIAQILRSEGITEFEWKAEKLTLKMKREQIASMSQAVGVTENLQHSGVHHEVLTESSEISGKELSAGHQVITSPIVGTFYRAPSPKSDAYVKEGDKVNKGQVLCILEAMKLMNELEAEYPCEIVKILVDNAQPVEFGEPLFEVKPL